MSRTRVFADSRSIVLRSLVLALSSAMLFACGENIVKSDTAGIQVTPDRFAFSKQAIGANSDRVVQVRNTGTGTLLITDVELSLENPAQEFELYWKVNPDSEDSFVGISRTGEDRFPYPLRIEPDEIVYLILNYSVERETATDGAVILETNLAEGRVSIPVVLTAGSAEINVSPTIVDFGRVQAGDSSAEEVTIGNFGQQPLEVRKILLNGSQDFIPLIEDDGIAKDPRRITREVLKVLEPNELMVVTVKYEPPVEGPDTAELSILSNDPNRPEVVVQLTANGATPCLRVNPPALEFTTSLVNRTDSRPLSIESCGGAAVEIQRIYLSPESDPAYELVEDSQPMLPAIMPAYAPADQASGLPAPARSIQVAFTPREQRIHNGTLIIESSDPVTPRREVSLLGRGVLNACPSARAVQEEFNVVPLDVVTLDGTPSIDQDGPDNRPVQYEWVIVDGPDGSGSRPYERFYDPAQPANGGEDDDVSTPTAVFFVDLAGTYTIELRVRDNLGLSSEECENPAVVTIVARPEEAIHVQLIWRTPLDEDETDRQGADLDLHLLHPEANNWFTAPYDCYYGNPIPEWGQLENPEDNPSLDIDDINGAGPENISLNNPEDTDLHDAPYIIGVHYYNSHDRLTGFDYGPSHATVRIFLQGDLAWDFTEDGPDGEPLPGSREMEGEDHFWDVAQVEWSNGAEPPGQVTTRNRYYTIRP